MAKEAKARILINALLERAGWRFFDAAAGPANVALETNVKLKKKTPEGRAEALRRRFDALGDDFESAANGYVDYLLLDGQGFPIAVLEAKSEKFDPLVGKEQARRYERGDVKGAEEVVVAALFNKPEDFFNLDKLRKAVQADRRITLREILAKAFGEIDRFPSRDELLEEELAKFVSIHKPDAQHMPVIRQFFKAYLTDGAVRAIVDSREFSKLADNPKVSLADIKALNGWRDVIPEYVKDYVSLNQFAA